MKKYVYVKVIILYLACNSWGQANGKWIQFDWQGQDIFGKYYPKVAMSIPLTIENLPYSFCGQFDLAATRTMIYGNSFKAYSKMYPEVLQKLDSTAAPHYVNGMKGNTLKNLNIKLHKTSFTKRDIVLLPNFGDEIPADSVQTKSQKLMGTIAPDLFQGKILVIDFLQNRLTTFDKLPRKYSKANFVNTLSRKGRIKIPVEIDNNTHYLMFDTGNCLSDMLLDKESINILADRAEPAEEFLNGSTWGQDIAYYSKKVRVPIQFNGQNLNIKLAQFSNLDSDVQFNKEEKILGLVGPLLFANKVVIIDYKNNRFGLLN